MQKSYEIKLYTYAGVFVKTIERANVLSGVDFSSSIQGWNGEVVVSMPVNSDTSALIAGYVCRIFVYSDNYPTSGKNIFTGICTIREYKVDPSGPLYTFTFIGIQYLLSKMYYKLAGIFTGTKTGTPGQIIKDVIDFYNAAAGYSWFSTTNIDVTGTSISLDVNYTYCMDTIKDASSTRTGYYLFIDGTGAVYYRQKSSTPDHLLTLGEDVDSVVIKKDLESMVNGHIVEWSGGIRPENVDASSQSTYFISQLKESKTDLKDTTTADNYSTAYIATSKNPISYTKVSVNLEFEKWIDGLPVSNVGIEELIPWHTVTILNTDDSIVNLQIYKIKYDIRGVELELEQIQTLGFLLSN